MRYLNIQTLEQGYYDRDAVLLHAAFQVLVDFIEKERPDKIIDWNDDQAHKQAWQEIRSLYDWWKNIRPTRRSPLDDKTLGHPPLKFKKLPESDNREVVMPNKKKYARYYQALKEDCKLEMKWLEEDQRNLHRLIDIRLFLWT
jgi:hypothetical protein